MLRLLVAVSVALILAPFSLAQIPTACTDADSLQNLICCPMTENGMCGEDAGRGSCVSVDFENHDPQTSDVRVNWPHYYTQICQCNGNYWGYDCSRCKFGYYGPDCNQFQVLPRPAVRDYSDEDWRDFISILRMSRTYDSGYSAVLEESVPGNASIETVPLTLYDYYVWVHHYTAKDSIDLADPLDYSHFGPAFYTWHRYLNLHLEWQIQNMLQGMGRADYHMYRLPYWDWRIEMQNSSIGINSDQLFSETRLGATRNISGFPRVVGELVEGGWDTICWMQLQRICDPRERTAPLQRCPFTGTNPCSSSNPDWPTRKDVESALSFEVYDVPPNNFLSTDGFRNFIEGNVTRDVEACRQNRMCQCIPGGPTCEPVEGDVTVYAVIFQMHTRVHAIGGIGDLNGLLSLPAEQQGQIQDVVGSPNDPLFIFHHFTIDCILEEYLRKYPDTQYPTNPEVRDGHRAEDFSRGFIPLLRNRELFVPGENFGYTCFLADIPDDEPDAAIHSTVIAPLVLVLGVLLAVMATSSLSIV